MTFVRSTETAGSPLLRRALSPDRLHPRSAECKKATAISPLCSPACKVSLHSQSTITTSTSPLPSRALHSSPGAECSSHLSGEGGPGHAPTTSHHSSHRKHSSKSLSVVTIPEEGPEQEEGAVQSGNTVQQSITDKILATFSGREGRGSRAGSADPVHTASPALQQSQLAQPKISKSASFREERREEAGRGKEERNAGKSVGSPKLSRTESMTERTVQKISKVIRGTSRSESRSKKNRESSKSPKGGTDTEKPAGRSNEAGAGGKKQSKEEVKEKKQTASTKEDKKSANEKREMFKSYKKDL